MMKHLLPVTTLIVLLFGLDQPLVVFKDPDEKIILQISKLKQSAE